MPISLAFDTTSQELDLSIANGALVTGDDITTLVLLALFSSNVKTSTSDQYWGTTYSPYPIGSRLALLQDAVKSGNGDILNQANNYATECLKPYLTLGIFTSLSVETEWQITNGTAAIIFNISIGVPNSTTPVVLQYGLNPLGTYALFSS